MQSCYIIRMSWMSRHKTGKAHTFLSLGHIMLGFFAAGSFIGIWHALPMLNVILDEQYFVSGVLRTMELRTILPPINEVPYGTVTFYLNYILQMPFLLVLFAQASFSMV